jgi:hypothetical protein
MSFTSLNPLFQYGIKRSQRRTDIIRDIIFETKLSPINIASIFDVSTNIKNNDTV